MSPIKAPSHSHADPRKAPSGLVQPNLLPAHVTTAAKVIRATIAAQQPQSPKVKAMTDGVDLDDSEDWSSL